MSEHLDCFFFDGGADVGFQAIAWDNIDRATKPLSDVVLDLHEVDKGEPRCVVVDHDVDV